MNIFNILPSHPKSGCLVTSSDKDGRPGNEAALATEMKNCTISNMGQTSESV